MYLLSYRDLKEDYDTGYLAGLKTGLKTSKRIGDLALASALVPSFKGYPLLVRIGTRFFERWFEYLIDKRHKARREDPFPPLSEYKADFYRWEAKYREREAEE